MNTPSPEIAAALGFDPAQRFEHLTALDTRLDTVDHGAFELVTIALAALIESAVAQQPDFDPMSAAPPPLAAARCEVSQWRHAPGIFMVRSGEADLSFRGIDATRMHRVASGELFVDAREQPFYLRVGLGNASQLWTMTPQHVSIDAPRNEYTERSPSADAVSRWSPEAAVAVSVPTIDEVFAGLARAAWMTDEVASRLAIGTAWEVASAWGLVARLGEPATKLSLAELLDTEAPETSALLWLRHNPAAQRALVAHIVHESDMLIDGLDALAEALVDNAPGARDEARSWLHRRDDLESVAFVLTRANVDVDVVRNALAAVDREAGLRQEMWAFSEALDDARLGSVSWQEPDAWWATAPLGL
jgi:hypothetical protein